MARGRSTNHKKPKGSGKRKKRRYGEEEEEEDDDDDYVLGNDEESESSFEADGGDSSSEESFDFSGSDEVEVEAAAASKPRKKLRGSRERTTVSAKRTISRVLDLEEEDYSHSDDDDEDFKPNEEEDDDNDEETHAIAGRNRRSAVKNPQNQHRKKRKPKKRKTRIPAAVATKTRRRRAAPRSDEDDDDFTVKDLVVADNLRKNRKKARRKRNKRFSVDSGSSDSDFIDSDDDFVASDPDLVVSDDDDDFVVKDRVTVAKKRKRGNTISRKKKTSSRTTTKKKKKKKILQVSDSSDSDYVIPEDEVRDLVIGGNGIVNQQQPKRIFAGRKGEQKAKVKEADVVEKQVCGVCLSEEQKTAVQGVLNCCNHYFCFACIMEWSKVESRCPLCKRRFTTITKPMRSDPGFGVRGAIIRVQKRDQVYQPSEEEIRGYIDPYENVVCMVCQEGGHDNFMLLCDICDSPAHTFCVGLGREVPEGNWYCEGCRSTGEGSSNSQGQTIVVDQGTSNSDSFSVALEPEGLSMNPHTNTNPRQSPSTPVRNRFDLNVPSRHLTEYNNGMSSPLGRPATHRHANTNSPGQSSSQGFDLNLPPGHLLREDHGVGSQASGAGASTLFGRRAIHQRIRILLSGNRPTDMLSRAAVPRPNGESDVATLEVGQGVGSHPVLHSNPSLAPCMFGEGSSFRHVEGAKEQVASMVNRDMKMLSTDNQLERGHFKDIARRCIHTILAACGIDHRRSLVDPTSVQSLEDCSHGFTDEGHTALLKGHCPPCFRSFVTSVVRKLMNNTTHER